MDEIQQPDNRDDYKYIAVRRTLTSQELKEITDWVLKTVAIPPVELPIRCDTCGDAPGTARLELRLAFEDVQLASNSNERFVGWISSKYASRIVVAERQKGSLQLDWVSPAVSPDNQTLMYRDVNADGVAEIWVGFLYSAGKFLGPSGLSIFDLNGKELTREAGDCQAAVYPIRGYGPEPTLSRACPIAGDISHYVEENGTVSLNVTDDEEGSSEEPRIYRFINGRYVWTVHNPNNAPSTATSRIALNQAGITLMNAKNYTAAAAKFVHASDMDPSNAEFANNAGFAYYKMKEYETSAAWLRAAIEADPKRAIAYLNLGDSYAMRNHNAEARQAYTKYLELAPDSKSGPEVNKKLEALPTTP